MVAEDPQIAALRNSLDGLSEHGGRYRTLYYGKGLGAEEIAGARDVMLDIRQATNTVKSRWVDFRQGRQQARNFWAIVNSPGFKSGQVQNLMSDLLTISSVGSEALTHLDPIVVYTLHYQRQTTYLGGDEASKTIQEDAIELQAWLEQAARQLRDEVASTQAQIHLASVYSQTLLTSQISVLTRTLVILTGAAIIISSIAAVTGVWALTK